MTGVELIRKTLMKTRNVKCYGCRQGRRIYWEHNVRWHHNDTGVGDICHGSFERSLLELSDERLLASVEKEEWPHPTSLERYKALLDRMGVPYREIPPRDERHICIAVGRPLEKSDVKWLGPSDDEFAMEFDKESGKLVLMDIRNCWDNP